MMYGLKLKAFYEEVETTGSGVEQVEASGTKERQDLEELKAEMESVEESGNVKTEVLSKVSKEELAKFLSEKFFSGDKVSYVNFIKESPKTLNLCMRQALQLLSENDTKKYDAQGKEVGDDAENGKTVQDWLTEKGGINANNDSTLIKILQTRVGAVADGKPGPQTVAYVISYLGGNVDMSEIYDKVNTTYENSGDLKINKITTFVLGNVHFKYNSSFYEIKEIVDSKTGKKLGNKIVEKNNTQDEGAVIEVTEDEHGKKEVKAEGFVFKQDGDNSKDNPGWLIKVGESSEELAKNEEEKDPLEGLSVWAAQHEKCAKLIRENKEKLSIPADVEGKKAYVELFEQIMNDPNKNGAFKSLLNLIDDFWEGCKLDKDGLKALYNNLGTSVVDGDDGTFEKVDDEDDYLTIKGGELVKEEKNEGGDRRQVFEANGTSSRDDYRFDSVKAFIKFISGGKKNIISASKHVEDLATGGDVKDKLGAYRNRFDNDVWQEVSLAYLDFTLDQYKTFLSLLTLSDRFWKNCKLSKKDLDNFKAGMDKDIFDYRSGSSTVFHENGDKFEVDGTGFIDEPFTNVRSFFDYLEKELGGK